jgi:hypothetical protein
MVLPISFILFKPMTLTPRAIAVLAFIGIFISGLFLGILGVAAYHRYAYPMPTDCEITGEYLGCERTKYPYGTKRRPADLQPTTTVTSSVVGTDMTILPSTGGSVQVPLTQELVASLSGFTRGVDATSSTLPLEWIEAVSVDPVSVLKPLMGQFAYSDEQAGLLDPPATIEEYARERFEKNGTSRMWKKGMVTSGSYRDSVLYAWERSDLQPDGPDFPHPLSSSFVWILVSPNGEIRLVEPMRYVWTTAVYGPYAEWEKKYFIPAPFLSLPYGPLPPDTLSLADGKVLKGVFSRSVGYLFLPDCGQQGCRGTRRIGETTDGRPVFDAGEQGLVPASKDTRVFPYASLISVRYNRSGTADTRVQSEDIVWNKGYGSKLSYSPALPRGCGVANVVDLMTDNLVPVMSSLALAGKTKDGDPVYAPKNATVDPNVQLLYDQAYIVDASGTKQSIEYFLEKDPMPLFYWKDAFGRWVRYVSESYAPAAECGKPVIYLYPEKTMDVSVRLPSFIDVTVSEPTYPAGGWRTTAHPDGTLVMKDGSRYGSLFWEGIGVGYEAPKDGFIVKDGEVDQFLKRTLAKYGLNEKESQEFREFWVPHMTGSPYYRVSFLTTEWSKAAPLYVSPAPQTQIRIFMDWRPLGGPINLPEPKIETPKRQGFTLVEWGGTLWK